MKTVNIAGVLYDSELDIIRRTTSPNKGPAFKEDEIKFIIAHWTGGNSFESAMSWLSNPKAKASAHFVVGRGGEIGQLVTTNERAWHAGKSQWPRAPLPWDPHPAETYEGLNRYAIGIEFVNLGKLTKSEGGTYLSWKGHKVDPDNVVCIDVGYDHNKVAYYERFPQEQIDAGLELMQALCERYATIEDLLGHMDVAPTRKLDPGPAFPMEQLRSKLFGRSLEDTERT